MPWWGWVVVGVVLLAGEMVANAQFYMVFLGVAAVGVGLLTLAGVAGGPAMQWLLYGVLAAVLVVGFRARLYGRLRSSGSPSPGYQDIVGETAIARSDIGPGSLGRAELRGTTWMARNVGPGVLTEGTRTEVVRVSGLVIDVRRAE